MFCEKKSIMSLKTRKILKERSKLWLMCQLSNVEANSYRRRSKLWRRWSSSKTRVSHQLTMKLGWLPRDSSISSCQKVAQSELLLRGLFDFTTSLLAKQSVPSCRSLSLRHELNLWASILNLRWGIFRLASSTQSKSKKQRRKQSWKKNKRRRNFKNKRPLFLTRQI